MKVTTHAESLGEFMNVHTSAVRTGDVERERRHADEPHAAARLRSLDRERDTDVPDREERDQDEPDGRDVGGGARIAANGGQDLDDAEGRDEPTEHDEADLEPAPVLEVEFAGGDPSAGWSFAMSGWVQSVLRALVRRR